jgi:hypothetical protein
VIVNVNVNIIALLQHCVTAVIVLGLFETFSWYFDYYHANSTGERPLAPIVLSVLLSCLKRTLSRLLVLVVCMGYGVATQST